MEHPIAGRLYCICFKYDRRVYKSSLEPYDTDNHVEKLVSYLRELQTKYQKRDIPYWLEDQNGQRYD